MVSPHLYQMQNPQFVFPSPGVATIQGSQVDFISQTNRSFGNLQQPVASFKKRKRVSFQPSSSLNSVDESSLLVAKALVDLSKGSSAAVSRKNAE
jgi:hypothetical protein